MLISNLISSLSNEAIISGIDGNHLIVYDRNLLKIYHSFQKFENCIEYSREVSLNLSTEIPKRANIREILVDRKGLNVVLIGRRSIYLVRICPEILSSKPDNLSPEYFCECFPIHDSLLLQNSSISVIQARFLWQKMNDKKILGVLFSDNVLRFYNISQKTDGFLACVDFRPLMHLSAENSANNTFGLSRHIVSFDFKPTMADETSCVVFAVDSDAELYYSVVFSSCFTEGVTSQIERIDSIESLPCDPVALQFVETPYPQIATVFALLSGSNVVTNILAIATELGAYEIFVHDQLQLPTSSGDPKFQPIRSKSVYEIATSSSLFSVDISGWANKLNVYESKLSETSVFELLSVAGRESLNKSTKPVKSVSIELLGEDEENAEDGEFVENEIMHFIVLDEPLEASSHILAITKPNSIVLDKSSSHGHSTEQSQRVVNPRESIEEIMGKMTPFAACVISDKLSEMEAMSVARKFFESAEKRLETNRALAEKAMNRCVDVQLNAQILAEKQHAMDERLLHETEEVEKVKQSIFELKNRVDEVDRKVNVLASRIENNIPLSDVELRMFDRLKAHQQMLIQLSIAIPKLTLELSEQQRFANALSLRKNKNQNNKFANVEKNEREIKGLEKRMENLQTMVENVVG